MTPPAETIFQVARLPRTELLARYLATIHPSNAEQRRLAPHMTSDALATRIWEHDHAHGANRMTIRTERVYTVTCNYCGAEHRKPGTGSALQARIAAGVDGWAYRPGKSNSADEAMRSPADACPEHAPNITQENPA